MVARRFARSTPGRVGLALAAVLTLGSALAGCVGNPVEATPAQEPVVVEHAEDSEIGRLSMTEQGADRLGLETSPVTADASGGLRIPYAALLYLADGSTWVYAETDELVFERAAVSVVRVEGDSVLLSSGPEPGTDVVVIGAAELLGAEFDTAH